MSEASEQERKPNLNVIIVGIGGRGQWLVGALAAAAGVTITALADLVPARAEFAAEQHHLDVPIFQTLADALDADCDCDLVCITTADGHHAEVVIPALEAGKYVFCEKPLEISVENCRAIIDADRRAGGKTFIGFNLRYAPTYAGLKKELDRGTIGEILTIQMDEFYDGGRTYFRRWNRLRSEGGGLWITKASHDFDMMAWLAGKPPVSVSAYSELSYYRPKPEADTQCRNCKLADTCPDRAPVEPPAHLNVWEANGGPPHDLCLYNSDKDTFDHGIATVRFDEGIIGAYTCNVVSGFSNRRIRVAGTQGTLEGSLIKPGLTLYKRDPSETVKLETAAGSDLHGGADGHVVEGFLSFARGETQPKCRPREASVAVRLGLAARTSCDEQREVNFDEFNIDDDA